MTCIIQQGPTLTLFLLGEFFPKFLGGFFRTHLTCWWLKSGTSTSWSLVGIIPHFLPGFYQGPSILSRWLFGLGDFWLPSTVWHHPSYQTFRIRNISRNSVTLPPKEKDATPTPRYGVGFLLKHRIHQSINIINFPQRKTHTKKKITAPNMKIGVLHPSSTPRRGNRLPSLWLFVLTGDHRVWRSLR